MISIMSFAILALAGIAMAFPQPHNGMVDNANIRDVGVIYTGTNFTGAPKFIFELKARPECIPLGVPLYSAKICKEDITCVFYTGSNCVPSEDNFAVAIGCGDAPVVKTPKGNYFGWHRCGHAGKVGFVNYTIRTQQHKKVEGESAVMGK